MAADGVFPPSPCQPSTPPALGHPHGIIRKSTAADNPLANHCSVGLSERHPSGSAERPSTGDENGRKEVKFNDDTIVHSVSKDFNLLDQWDGSTADIGDPVFHSSPSPFVRAVLPRSESHDNPFKPDGTLYKEASLVIRNSIIKRERIEIHDPSIGSPAVLDSNRNPSLPVTDTPLAADAHPTTNHVAESANTCPVDEVVSKKLQIADQSEAPAAHSRRPLDKNEKRAQSLADDVPDRKRQNTSVDEKPTNEKRPRSSQQQKQCCAIV